MQPLNLLIKPASSLCNMKCEYCFYKDVSKSREQYSMGMMSLDTLEAVVRRAFEYATDFVGFAFQGGEPTLVGLDFYKTLISLQHQYNTKKIKVSNTIQTNGYIIDEEWARFFADNHFLVGLSLDGTKETHDSLRVDTKGKGTFNRVIRAADILQKNGVEFNILCVVNNFVARYPKEVYSQLKKYKYIQFIACLDPLEEEKTRFSLSEERYASFLKQTFNLYYEDFIRGNYVSIRNFDNYINILLGRRPESCAMNGFCTCYCVIEGDGSVYPCDFYVLDEWQLGNVHESSFGEIIGSEKAKEFVSSSLFVHEECKKCQYYKLCRGGCRREREPFADGLPLLNRHCKAYKEFFNYSIERMMEIAIRLRSGYTPS
ncbi:MAG: anaerobic sulfatase maturase [Ruminococcaceae bacterium]|nr:anaerobic sulfatase maturase [Oscillospiraceae bacterium]